MKGKPFLVAISAFFLVLIGGAAIAGVGVNLGGAQESVSSSPSDVVTTTETPEKVTTTTQAEEPAKDEPPSDDPVKDEPAKTDSKAEVPKKKAEEPKPKEPKTEEPKSEVPEETTKPELVISKPADGARFDSKVVVFGGEVSDGAKVYRGKYTAKQDGGEWWIELVLSPGKNYVAFEAINESGASTTAGVTVYYDAPAKEVKPKDDTKGVAFTANQTYGECAEVIPYDVFYGTAKPGTTIKAQSEYGGNSVVANDKGKWEMKVTFPNAPSNKTFKVTIKASTGESKKFSFTNVRQDSEGGKDG